MHTLLRRASSKIGLAGALIGLALFAMVGPAPAAVVTWQDEGPVTNVNVDNFDSGTITFTPFLASALDAIVSPTGVYHNHSSSAVNFTLDLRLDNVWTNIWSATGLPGTGAPVSSIAPPAISFATASLDGIRFGAVPVVGQAYHLQFPNSGKTEFHFSTVVPIPAALPLFASALAGFGLIGYRRRKTQAS